MLFDRRQTCRQLQKPEGRIRTYQHLRRGLLRDLWTIHMVAKVLRMLRAKKKLSEMEELMDQLDVSTPVHRRELLRVGSKLSR